jgi:AraC-like DNA-binding protein
MTSLTATIAPARRAKRSPPLHDAALIPYELREEGCMSGPEEPAWEKRYGRAAIGVVLTGWFKYRTESSRSVVAVPGAAVLGNEGERFTCHHLDTAGNRRLVVRFEHDFLADVANDCGLDDTRFHAAALPPGKSSAEIFGWMRRLATPGLDHEEAAYALAALALKTEPSDRPPVRISARDKERIRSTIRYIETSYDQPCSLDQLAQSVSLSRYHFLRVFMAATGQSPNQYVINTRLRAAAEQLLTTAESVSAVAFKVGFNDLSHFHARFRAVFGCSPRRWRADALSRANSNASA